MVEMMLTTTDNPFSPFDDWDAWYAFDERMGYCTSGLIARVIITSDELSDLDQQQDFNRAVLQVGRVDTLGKYKILERETSTPDLSLP